ncbi:MAG: endolytic transglycosylase MltG [Methanobrevibacter sp.]|nr:endolytic transglycosylase MltG [Methanobrevibacter sp.]
MFCRIFCLGFLGIFVFETSSVGGNKSLDFEVEQGDTYYTLSDKLKEKDLIKSEFFYKLFIKIKKPGKLVLGEYELNKNMSVKDIINTLSDEKNTKDTSIKLTLKEGTSVSKFAGTLEDKTDIKASEFLEKINEEEFLDELIKDYWFITDEVKNSDIYYSLEGYLYPDTYSFEKHELEVEKIVRIILDNTDKKLSEMKADIESSSLSVHKLLTLASLIELEAGSLEDRAMVSGVFYNRLNRNWSLGSDVTTYYSAKKAMTETLTKADLDACNGYNTRCVTMKGLPVGPIDNPGITSIKAAVNPTKNDYYYFVADSNKKVYFTKNATEHANIIAKLKKEGKWIG